MCNEREGVSVSHAGIPLYVPHTHTHTQYKEIIAFVELSPCAARLLVGAQGTRGFLHSRYIHTVHMINPKLESLRTVISVCLAVFTGCRERERGWWPTVYPASIDRLVSFRAPGVPDPGTCLFLDKI